MAIISGRCYMLVHLKLQPQTGKNILWHENNTHPFLFICGSNVILPIPNLPVVLSYVHTQASLATSRLFPLHWHFYLNYFSKRSHTRFQLIDHRSSSGLAMSSLGALWCRWSGTQISPIRSRCNHSMLSLCKIIKEIFMYRNYNYNKILQIWAKNLW